MNSIHTSTPPQDTEEHTSKYSWVKDIVLGLISLALRAASGFEVTMANKESISPLDKTPQTRNSHDDNSDKFEANFASMLTDSKLDWIFELGYDSDGEMAPYLTTNNDFEELEKSCDIPVGAEVSDTETEKETQPSIPPPPPADNFVMIEEAELKKLLVDQLRKELKKRGLATTGKKQRFKIASKSPPAD